MQGGRMKQMPKTPILMLIVLLSGFQVLAQPGKEELKTTPLKSLKGKIVLKAEESPYLIGADLVQSRRDSLVVEPGVRILVEGYSRVVLRGYVSMEGKKEAPIKVEATDSNLGWVGLFFSTGENELNLHWLEVKNAFKNVVSGSKGSLQNSIFSNNHYGLWVERSPLFVIQNSTFSENRYGITAVNGTANIQGGVIRENSFGVFLERGGNATLEGTKFTENEVHDTLEEKVGEGKLEKRVLRALESQF